MIRQKIGDRTKKLRISKQSMNQEEFSKKIGWDKSYHGTKEVFNMSSGEIKFMKKYKDNHILILVTEVNSHLPKTKKFTCEQVLSLRQEYPSVLFYG